ncbi:glycosyltransferase family 2 protein [Thiomonas sp.]
MGEPVLSILVPVRNEADHLPQTLGTLRDRFPDAELLVVLNGCTDTSEAIAAGLAKHDTALRVLRSEPAGKGAALRVGAEAARGTWLLWQDADLEYDLDDTQAAWRKLQADPDGIPAMWAGERTAGISSLPWSSLLATRLLGWMLNPAEPIRDTLTGTRFLPRKTFLEWRTREVGFGIETEVTRVCLHQWIPIRWFPVRYRPRSRRQGKKIRPYHLFRLLWVALRPGTDPGRARKSPKLY